MAGAVQGATDMVAGVVQGAREFWEREDLVTIRKDRLGMMVVVYPSAPGGRWWCWCTWPWSWTTCCSRWWVGGGGVTLVPIVPDYLYSLEHPAHPGRLPGHLPGPDHPGPPSSLLPALNSSLLGRATREHLPSSHIPEDIIEENGKVVPLLMHPGQVGVLFASKSLVQLVANPVVGALDYPHPSCHTSCPPSLLPSLVHPAPPGGPPHLHLRLLPPLHCRHCYSPPLLNRCS